MRKPLAGPSADKPGEPLFDTPANPTKPKVVPGPGATPVAGSIPLKATGVAPAGEDPSKEAMGATLDALESVISTLATFGHLPQHSLQEDFEKVQIARARLEELP
jgi:hypothetical protein